MKHFKQPNRQFSNTSSTYSNQTQQSSQSTQSAHSNQSTQSSSSVIINKLADDDTKHSLNNVLDYINKVDDFNPNDLYLQRQQRKFVTKFGTSYHQKAHSAEDFSRAESDYNKTDSFAKTGDIAQTDDFQSGSFGDAGDGYDEDSDLEILLEDQEDDENSEIPNRVAILEDHPLTSLEPNDYEDDDMLLPPSPPRSPPKELDPDKLYGLYDFSGPDPSHCSITRNEPVFLINDQDNYWWLIKKLTKDQRRQLLLERSRNFDDDFSDVESDEEDGKVGFVPAECLETHGERLARLNCFKNEELERSSRDLLIKSSNPSSSPSVDNITENKSFSSIGLGSPANFQKSPDTTLSRSGSILRDPNTTKQSINKSVTFEDLSVLENEDEDEVTGNILNNLSDDSGEHDFPEHYYDNLSIPKVDDEEKRSEVMSDIYPSETPLLISKRKDSPMPEKREWQEKQWSQEEKAVEAQKKSIVVVDLLHDSGVESHDSGVESHDSGVESDEESLSDAQVHSDNQVSDTQVSDTLKEIQIPSAQVKEVHSNPELQSSPENSVPSSESDTKPPQTPQSNYQTPNLIPSSQFQTNSQFDQFKTPNQDTPDDFKTPNSRTPSTPHSERIRRSQLLDRLNQVTADIQNELSDYSRELGEDADVNYDNPYYNQGFLTVFENGSFSSRSVLEESPAKEEIKEDFDSEDEHQEDKEGVTPLTSTNSLTHDLDKRKSKPVHEMFIPILGKFDELAEKLAEIDEML